MQYLPVTRLDDPDLVARFKAELERLTGQFHQAIDHAQAVEIVLSIIGEDRAVMAWESLPLPGLAEALAQRSIKVTIPRARGDQRTAELVAAEPIRVGITGADAAFATTGTLALVTRANQGRIPSERKRLFPRLEDWIGVEGRAALAVSNSIALVTGPSRTGDIEMQTILGVHGPGVVHVVLLP
jgi:L-lactate dehydrogenase complex protein LldG